ncbi:MAG: N-acetyl-gamma-glutamyl-phosphate reductase [Melioribacteraceae bacterium]|nr:N-acetyl-gamma-glutamyl-phosphate reductase [Melioribacteraceae bacterium]MCF8355068.1 N-acetyl-gamma-glutamyl-phosphate reductase [Melioribacteraceae bacterium]MCF8395661.1 N-acetyl-gamma-glutamyl-phosphate reductase [Melioribacteraceae bacterium]MCF8420286.1 N-acetyl-gamma-glutamyl-phosphate reductase [Melioribacteraceae bacterium]
MNKIGIIGATGYTGSELVRILYNHSEVKIAAITSESHKGKRFSDIHPQFKNIVDIELIAADDLNPSELDLVFLALPHGVSMEYVKRLMKTNIKIIDLSGDFRLSSKTVYKDWYKKEHTYPEGIEKAVFGIPELYEEQIKNAVLVANPGCFPTGAILALAPLVKENLIDVNKIIVDSKTGVTGAGVNAKDVTHFPNVNDNFKPYGIKNHRHTIEIEEQLTALSSMNVRIQFTPHLLPVDRGILTSVYAVPNNEISEGEINSLFNNFYADNNFIRVLDSLPEIKNIRATNYIDIHPAFDGRTNNIMVFSAIDNLVRGASGQAVQNMNLMLGINQYTGLMNAPVRP